MIRQGDLLFVPVEEIPEQAKQKENGVIAEGEATGHHHRVASIEDAEVLVQEHWRGGAQVYVRVGPNGVSIVHEEHGPVALAPSTTYKVNRAREFDYLADAARIVRD